MVTKQRRSFSGTEGEYVAIHRKMYKILPRPELCSMCNQRRAIDLANISGKYTLDPDDWEYLCRRCHMLKDGRMKNLKRGLEGAVHYLKGKSMPAHVVEKARQANLGKKWAPAFRKKVMKARAEAYARRKALKEIEKV